MTDNEPHWYVAHTYSGYEKKVKLDIEQTIVNRNLQDQILEVSIPMINTQEEKNDEQKTVSHKMFPAYVLIKMYMNDDTWYVVRNTRGVTGFVGQVQTGTTIGVRDSQHGIKSRSTCMCV